MAESHLVYFIRARQHKWVKIGKSSNMKTAEKRIIAVTGREPFESEVVGVSSLLIESDVHNAFRALHIRAEWFRWTQAVRIFAARSCDVFWIERDGPDGWSDVVYSAYCDDSNEKTRQIQEYLATLNEVKERN